MENKAAKTEQMVTISAEEYALLKKQLAEKESQIAEKESQIAEKESQIAEQETKLAEQKDQIVKLEKELAIADEKLRLAIARMFGRKSEHVAKDGDLGEQLMFVMDEPEFFADKEEKPKETVTVKAYQRKKSGSVLDIVPDNTPVEIIEHKLEGNELLCPKCRTEMEIIGKDIRRTLKIKPMEITVQEDWYYTYGCRNCKETDIETPVVRVPKDEALIPGGYATPEAVSYIMTQKYTMASPLYRLEQEFQRHKVQLSRVTMSNWIMYCSEKYLKPVYEELRRHLIQEEILHADETVVQVLREPDKLAQSKSYMWLYMTGYTSDKQIVLYDYKPSRSAENPKAFLKGFKGYVHCDGYTAYRAVEGVIPVGCWVHARREFSDAMKAMKKTAVKGSVAEQGFLKLEEILLLEKQYREAGLTTEEIENRRLVEIKPKLDDIFTWAESVQVLPKTKTGKAVNYLINQKEDLLNFLKDGRLEASNNRAERSIKPFVIGRKNWLFCNTANGANASAYVYSIIETAKMNGLDPYRYLMYIFNNKAMLDNSETLQMLLPWNAPDSCRI